MNTYQTEVQIAETGHLICGKKASECCYRSWPVAWESLIRFHDLDALQSFKSATWPRIPNNSVPPISQQDLSFYKSIDGVANERATPSISGLDHEFKAAP